VRPLFAAAAVACFLLVATDLRPQVAVVGPSQIVGPATLAPTPSGAPPIPTNYCVKSGFGTTPVNISCAFSTMTSGHVLVLVQEADSTVVIGAPSGCVASWSLVNSSTSPTNQVAYIGTANTGSACNVTYSGTGFAGSKNVTGAAVDTSGTIASTDGSAFGAEGFCSPCNFPSITTTAPNDLVCGFGQSNGTTPTIGSSWTSVFIGSDSGGTRHIIGCEVQTTPGNPPTPGYTVGGTAQNGSLATVAVQP
jgi:hypothetical protein